ncbi:nuclease-related domain-containing protein [Alkalihalobacillus pseudalcaliphilus]|uniref:nuclease-related domain-containing protein n=1 Tax=Alkalihalobacillus pseudalcaliphilus TaxID=79884 RepID=UPI00064D85DF|nr:nuclease-related domain-containing protein [Alkalihalobacillus pseudalcaliphilus]KMK77420.1 hypothetical protein AB990_02790 [Alkalihalobacillus pseudalcaliphilus]
MILKKRNTPRDLVIQRSLSIRLKVKSNEQEFHLRNIQSGIDGEKAFDQWVATHIPEQFPHVQDIRFTQNGSTLQIDSIIITPENLFLFEIKNYQGTFEFQDHKLYTEKQKEINNPNTQLERTASLLRQWLTKRNIPHPPIQPYVIFINPHFYLYTTRKEAANFIFSNQLHAFARKLEKMNRHITNSHLELANQLILNHLHESPYDKTPDHPPEDYKKGFYCKECYSFEVTLSRYYLYCEDCKEKEPIKSCLLRTIDEYQILFKGEFTTTDIYFWCNQQVSKATIRRILSSTMIKEGKYRASVYKPSTNNFAHRDQ